MFIIPLDAAQQAKQVAPQIWVAVQQPAAGMPEGMKILITASTGAIIGIGGNFLMEFVRPWVAKGKLKRSIAKQLVYELRRNLQSIYFLAEMLESDRLLPGSWRKMYVADRLSSHDWGRYEFFLENRRETIYEMDQTASFANLKKIENDAREAAELQEFGRVKNLLTEFQTIAVLMIESLEKHPTRALTRR